MKNTIIYLMISVFVACNSSTELENIRENLLDNNWIQPLAPGYLIHDIEEEKSTITRMVDCEGFHFSNETSRHFSHMIFLSEQGDFFNYKGIYDKDTVFINYERNELIEIFYQNNPKLKILFFREDYLDELQELPSIGKASKNQIFDSEIMLKYSELCCLANQDLSIAYQLFLFIPAILYDSGYSPILDQEDYEVFKNFTQEEEFRILMNKCK
jgi:hypothetical protein